MVLEGVLVQVLNHFLRPYVKNLDPSQLKVAIFSGDVLLENLELKENALDDLNLPVRVFRGYLEKLKLKIPWKSLYSSPIVAEIDGLYAIVEPATAFKYDAEKSAKERRERKEKQLKRIEEARKRSAEPKNEKTGQDSGFVERLIAAAIRNIQITVKNIHICYEDSVTNVERPFTFGVTLDSLFVQSTDCEYVVGGTSVDPDPSSMLIYKLLQLNCLAVYWQSDDSLLLGTSPPDNWTEILKRGIARPNTAPSNTIHYVVHPITLEARLQATTKPGRKMDVPQALVKVTLHQVALSLSKQQFQDVTSLVESLDRMSINLKFLKYRPVGVGVKEDPRQWWRFAISAVTEEEVRRKMEMWSWKHIQQHRKWCRQYTDSYARKLVAKTITSGLQKELDFLEMELDVFNLTICRQLAESKAAVVKRQEEAEAKKEEGGGGGGWLGWATGWGTSSTEEEKGEEVAVAMPTEEELQEEKRRMYEAIGYSDNVEVPIYPKEYVAHSVSVNLEKASVQLWNENGTLAHVVTSSVTVRVQNRPSSKNITVQTTVGRLTARGFDCGTSGEGGEGPIIVSSKHNEEASLLDLSVDINPVNSTVSQRLRVKLLPIQITYHADTVDAVISMFKPSKDVHLQRLSAAAASTLEELKTQGRAGLEHAISQRKLLDLDVVLSSPCLVVPESGAITDSSCVLVVDLGQLEIKSDLRSYVPDVRGATDAELDEAFYDHFKLSLKRLQVLVAGPRQDWDSAWSSGTSPLHVLEPTSLELGLKKSLLPNDTRLPNLKVEGELPALTLSVSDKKLKQLLQVVQSLPLPPPSLAQQNMQSSSRYSIPDQPSQLGTDSMVENISETLFIGPAQPESESSDEEGFETASECESDEDGVLHHQTQQTQTAALSTTKLTLHFVVHQVGILFSEHHESTGCDTPRLHLLVTSVTSDLVMRSWDMRLSASIGDLCVVDHYLTGPNGGPGVFLDTQLTDGQKLITFNYSKFDPQAPHYATEFNLTRQTMAASLALLRLKLHSDSLLNLIDISRSITSVLKSTDSDRGKEAQESVQESVEPSVSSSTSSEGAEQQLPEGERQLQLKVSLAGLEVGMCGDDLGEVMSSSITGIEARVDKFQDYLQVEASVADIILLDNEPKVHHKKIIEKMDQEKKVISLKITVFNEPAFVRDPRDLSLSDMDITADVKRLRVMIIFSFLTRVQRFAMQFLHRLKLDQTTIDSAREAASNTASKTAEALRERSSSRVKLNVIIGAPLLVVPYTPPLSLSPPPSSSSSSPPPPALPPRQRAFVANLGELTVRNVFRLASDVAAEKIAGEQGEKGDQSRFLSSSGCPAVVDCMTVTISSVQLSRVMDVENASNELRVTKSDEIEADGHMLLKPLQFNGKITRLLSGWCTALPAVSVSCKLKRTQMQFSPQDYHDVMCVLQDIKTMNQKEESAVEVAATEGKPEEGKKETAVEEKAVVKVEGKGEGEGSSTGSVTVHVEADVESLELLLCSHVGDVAEIKIKGAAASVDMLNDKVAIKARISGVEVFDCTPGVLYHKIVSVEENRLAVEAWVDYFSNATKGEGAYDTSKCDLSVKLSVNRIRIVALYLFVSRVLNYIQQLHAQKQDHDDVFEPQDTQGLDETRAVQKTQGSKPGVPMRIKLDISVEAPEITMPLNSKSCDVVVLDLGQFSLRNGFLGLDVGFSKDKSMALYEQHNMELKDLKLYRSVWDGESNKHSDCQRDILKPVSLTVEIHRNLSADWYHGMPTLSIDAKLNPLLVVASGDDIESVCLILRGNLKESCPSDVDTGSGNVGRSFSARVAEDRQPIDSPPGTVPEDATDSSEQSFTELLISARMKTIGLKLYFKDHPLICEDKSTWEREGTRELAEISLEGLQARVKRESNGATSVSVSLDDCMLDDLRTRLDEDRESADEEEEDEEGSTRESSVDVVPVPKREQPQLRIRRMIEKRAFDKEPSKHLISLEYNITPDNSTNIVTAINGIQVLVNLKFIEALTVFLLESIKPLKPDKPVDTEEEEEKEKEEGREDTAPRHEVASSLSRTQSMVEGKGKESKMSISVKVTHPLVALLEDARQPYSPALVCQMEVCVNLTRKLPANCASLSGSLSGLSLSVARYPDLEKTILKPVLGPLADKVLVYMDQWDGVTKISATVPSLELVLSPATVRIVLNSIHSLSSGQADEPEVGETAPANLWTSRSITRGRLRKKWYLRDSEPSEDHLAPSVSHLTTHFSTVSSAPSQLWNESFELEVANITVVVEQEVATPSLRTFPAISMAMGKYSSTALTLQLHDWSSKLKVNTELHLEVAYYNIRNDSWEPILEPIVDPRNKDRYISWGMKAAVVRQPPSHSKHLVEDAGILGEVVEEEDKEEGEEEVNLSVDVWAESALQLTLTKSSLNIFSQLVQAYTEKKAMVIEEVDTPETYDAAFTVVNKLGRDCPVTVKPAHTLKVHGAYSPVLRQGDSALPLHPTEGVVKMKPGEFLPRDSHLGRVHILQLQIEGFADLDVALGMYERVYYPLVPQSTAASTSGGGSGDREKGGSGVVVDIDRTAGAPVVTLRSPLQVHNHLDQPVTVHHSFSHTPPPLPPPPPTRSETGGGGGGGVALVPPDSLVPLPLSASRGGFLFFQLPHTGLSQPPVRWGERGSVDVCCSVTRPEAQAGGAHGKQKFSFIHTAVEEEEYSRSSSVPLSQRVHHLVHLHQPLVVHNLLPYSLSLGEYGHSMVLIASGSQAHISYTKLSQTKKFLVEVQKKDKRWSGSFVMGSKSDEETVFTVSHESCNLELLVKKEEKGAWQLSVCSRNWMVNKTGLTLQYRAPEGFFSFGQKPTEVYTHDSKSAISLYPHEEVCVRVVKGDRYSEWSNKFSLETLGSEGIFTCSFKNPSEELQIGTKVDLANFGTTRVLTLSPFYMINNSTRDRVSFRECSRSSSKISTIVPGQLVPFWPSAGSKSLEISVGDDTMRLRSSPLTFTETACLLVRTRNPQVTAVVVEVQVTGSANIITFTPYYSGCVPLQLVNHSEYHLPFKQIDGPCVYRLEPKQSLMYTWDLPLGEKVLLLFTNRLDPKVDGSGNFFLSQDDIIRSSSGSVEGDSLAEETHKQQGEEEEEGKEEEEEGEEEGEEVAVGQEVTQYQMIQGGTGEVDFSLPKKLRRLSDEVMKSVGMTSHKKKRRKKKRVYWISFMDGLQRVLLLTSSHSLVKSVSSHGGTAKEPPHTELSLSLIGTGLSLVDDLRGQEVAYIGIPQSQKEWQVRVKKLWKALPHDVSDKLEKLHNNPSRQKTKGRRPLPDSVYEVDFSRMYLYVTKTGSKNKLRRSHFEGVYARVTLSEHLTSVSVRISHIQVDNQLPLALQPIIIYPYPPPPSIASSCAPKPFIEGTLVIHKTEQSNVSQIQFLQVLVQEVGVNLDMSFLMALLGLFSNLSTNSTEAQIVRREVEYANLPLRESKVVAVSAAVSRKYFKLLHLSPLIIHLSFSLEMSDQEGKEAKKATETNIFMSMIFNVLLSFATIVGKMKDAELHLRYFELENEALTQQALMDRVQKHYMQEGVIQMYSVVLGLEVLGNPVGFVRGLKKGTVGLFYHPLQGAVLGPEEFMEGVVLGSRQFVGGTVGGISGVLGKVTGVLGDTAANLTMDEEFQSQRKRERTRGNVGQSLEGAARGVFAGVTGVISQPIKGAKKEGLLGLVKGAGKGVLGLVLRPTGGLIDLTSATFNAVQRRTKVGNYDITQLRPTRFIGQPKFVSPYSPHKAEGYALFLALENGRLRGDGDIYFDFVELEENPLRNLLVTNNRFMVIKRNAMFDRFEEEEVVMFRDMCGKTRAERNRVVVPVLEEQGWFLSSKKKVQTSSRQLEVPSPKKAAEIVNLVNQAYQEYCTTQTKKSS